MLTLSKSLMVGAIMGLFCLPASALENSFIAKEGGKIVKQIGKCEKRHSPFSSFKIPLAVIGFDSGILISPEAPAVEVTPEIEKNYFIHYNPKKYPGMLFWKETQTPQSWMRNSVVWYSLYITHKLGMKKFQEYANKLNYGNKNVIGDPVKKDGLMGSWIDGSIEISPLEQVEFIENLANIKLPVSKAAQENTLQIIYQ
ncbi:MAG: serine hydrolase [Candidatus Jidaibacter sp.]|jgi:beta-lactamase class D|nr:serine hydrolase [Candidatus Jidaibacter sp.]